MATESLAELRDWLFLLLLCLTLLAEVLELAAAAIALETGEGEEGIVCPSVCRCDEGFVYCNDRGLSLIPPLPLTAAILYLQSNRLSNAGLPPSLERSTSIRVIYLYANQLDEFPIHLPPSLRELHLQDNNIRTLPRSSLAKLPLLERLHLDDNSISTVSIQERAFSGTPRLRLLFLSRNHLSSIPAGLPASLEELRLDDNRINTIPTHAFRGLSSLRRLVLDGNLLANTRIADDTFSRLSNLTELSLVRNAMQSPPVNLPSSHLVRLHLQDNGMTHIPRGALDGMRRLQKLDLSGNNLTSLPRGLFKDTDSLELLLLRGNPWYCSCSLRWLHAWLHSWGSAVTVRGLTCQGPEAVKGQSLKDLTDLMEQCEGPPAGPATGVGVNPSEKNGGGDDSVGGDGQAVGSVPHASTTTNSLLVPTQGSLFTLRAKRPGLVMPLPAGGEGHVTGGALELTVKALSADSVLVSWLCPQPAPSFRLSWLRLGTSAALGSITETLVPGERRQYHLTQLTPRSHYLICLLPLRQETFLGSNMGTARVGSVETNNKDSTPACAQIETGEAVVNSRGEGSDKDTQDSELSALPLAGIIGGATALVSLLLIFGIFCWYGQRTSYKSGDSHSYNRGRGAKNYDDYVESGTKKDNSILEIRAPPAGFQMTAMAHQPLQPKLEDVTYIHTIFPSSSSSSSHANGTYRSNHRAGSLNGTILSQTSQHHVTYGTNRGYREGGIPDIDYAYT
ncbi:leucine-rich repeat transmembrane protein FLRT1 [Syngnathus typhle]|uniref:leucine-rich repeat transmembrane protein FLRT1 n=1 Tax=Syngnathus typhle TaxID=161592 RepID=UPI002A6A5E6A|nr:leucine-rich repeat transmembrane protein FLRT1 [Syngnathus typhle]XP_061138550.1 leucine-rich repeat transmembrane protein FLRT1 [Syngnathus typhle]XP_061138559.1 leucine-rich repeat transmembrane protein FLRT1 [Syngnathus typhle]XP_061138566.1 leucine-rich repeat transmembrane protein FLRT1 [Syngnathus typhle]XP_061138573.1 leucine-rich repeat transmembrane protein FLRT1 [Syngnathus typhle]